MTPRLANAAHTSPGGGVVSVVVGLDLSLRATGWATDTAVGVIKPGKLVEGARLAAIRDRLAALTDWHTVDLVVIEDLPKHAMSAGLTGQVHGAVKLWLHDLGCPPPVLIPPATLKSFATGSGAAKKSAMLATARERLGFAAFGEDEADALWLHQFGRHLVAHPDRVKLPLNHLRVLAKVAWP